MLTVNDAAERLGLSPTTVRQQILAGKIAAKKIGPIWFVDAHSLRTYRRHSLGKPGPKKGSRAAHQ